jgi:hypothetical protein
LALPPPPEATYELIEMPNVKVTMTLHTFDWRSSWISFGMLVTIMMLVHEKGIDKFRHGGVDLFWKHDGFAHQQLPFFGGTILIRIFGIKLETNALFYIYGL